MSKASDLQIDPANSKKLNNATNITGRSSNETDFLNKVESNVKRNDSFRLIYLVRIITGV